MNADEAEFRWSAIERIGWIDSGGTKVIDRSRRVNEISLESIRRCNETLEQIRELLRLMQADGKISNL
jgi:hypothetical protein